MPEPKSFHEVFIDELRDAYDAEKQLTKALPKMARAAISKELRSAFEDHLKETEGHVARLEEVFASLQEKPRGKHCDGIAGIIEEGKSILEEDIDESALDACLIAAGQRAEHYEMAAYRSLIAWARAIEHKEAAAILQETLDEEKAADEKLSSLAEGGINAKAAESAHAGADDEDDEEDTDTEDDAEKEDKEEDKGKGGKKRQKPASAGRSSKKKSNKR